MNPTELSRKKRAAVRYARSCLFSHGTSWLSAILIGLLLCCERKEDFRQKQSTGNDSALRESTATERNNYGYLVLSDRANEFGFGSGDTLLELRPDQVPDALDDTKLRERKDDRDLRCTRFFGGPRYLVLTSFSCHPGTDSFHDVVAFAMTLVGKDSVADVDIANAVVSSVCPAKRDWDKGGYKYEYVRSKLAAVPDRCR